MGSDDAPSYDQKAREAWAEAARRLETSHRLEVKGDGWPRLAFEHGGQPVTASIVDRRGKLRTLVEATARGSGDLGITARREGPLASIGKRLGLKDIQLGDPDFDRRYLVRATSPALVALWLTPKARADLVAASADASEGGFWEAALDAGQLTLGREGAETNPDALATALRAAVSISERGIKLTRALAQTAERLGATVLSDGGALFSPGGAFSLALSSQSSGRLTIDWLLTPEGARRTRLTTRLRCPRRSRTWDHFVISKSKHFRRWTRSHARPLEEQYLPSTDLHRRYRVASEEPSLAGPRLGPEVLGRLLTARPEAVIVTGRELLCLIDRFLSTADALEVALALMRSLAEHLDDGLEELLDRSSALETPLAQHQPWSHVAESVEGHLIVQPSGLPTILLGEERLVQATLRRGPRRRDRSTRVATSVDGAGHLRFRISGSGLGEGQDEDLPRVTGDRAFDDRFRVRTNDEAAARLWLGETIRGLIFEMNAGEYKSEVNAELDDERLLISTDEWEDDSRRLGAAIRCAVELGRRGARLMRWWGELAAALGGSLEGEERGLWAEGGGAAIVARGARVELLVDELLGMGPGVTTRVRLSIAAPRGCLVVCPSWRHGELLTRLGLLSGQRVKLPPASLSKDHVVSCDDLSLAATLTDAVAERLLEVGPTVTTVTGEAVTLLFEGVLGDEARLRGALELVSTLHDASRRAELASPYR